MENNNNSNPQYLSTLSATALPLVDQEYNIPEYKAIVDYMIAEEMHNSSNGSEFIVNTNQLSERFSALWSDEELAACLTRIEKRGLVTQPKLQDVTAKNRSLTALPAITDDIQVWQEKVNRLKSYLLHQENELTGLDLLVNTYSDDNTTTTATTDANTNNYNNMVQRQQARLETRFTSALQRVTDTHYTHATQQTSRQLLDTQKQRTVLQQRSFQPLAQKYHLRWQHANVRRYEVVHAYDALRQQLRAKGFDYVADREEEAARTDAAKRWSYADNNTVKEYETVSEHYEVGEEDDDVEKNNLNNNSSSSSSSSENNKKRKQEAQTTTTSTVEEEDNTTSNKKRTKLN